MKITSKRKPSNFGYSFLKLIMRTFVFLFCSICFALSPNKGLSQNADVVIEKNKTLNIKQAFKLINKQTDFKFGYRSDLIKNAPELFVEKGTIKVRTLLDRFLLPINFTYEFTKNKTILVKRKPEATVDKTNHIESLNVAQFQVSGTVSDNSGTPLSGANIVEKGTTNGVQTDFDGNFTITSVDENATLVVSYIGFKTQEIAIAGQATLSITMTEDAAGLDEVVVIGYGSVKKSDLTGSVATVSAADITRIPTTDPIKALQGSAPGVRVSVPSGAPGSGALIRIRGGNSLSGGNEPLYVVDGVLLDASLGNEIGVEDIKSIDILKDASSTAIYGSRGANGVVVITTKRGRSGKTIVNYSTYSSVQSIIRKLDLLDADDFKTLNTEAFAFNGLDPEASVINSQSDIDWQDELYQRALQQNHYLSITGGSEKSTFFMSAGYLDQEGLIENTGFDRVSFRLNSDHFLTDNFKVRQNLTISRSSNNFLDVGSLSNAVLWAAPTLPIRDEDGNFTEVSQPFARTNPIGLRDLSQFESWAKDLLLILVLDMRKKMLTVKPFSLQEY